MKQIKISFLFFCLLIFIIPKVESQQKIVDSSSYYNSLIGSPKKSENLTEAFSFFKNQLAIHEKNDHPLRKVSALISIAQTQKKAGFLNDSENSAVDALEILDKLDSNSDDDYVSRYRLSLYNHLGKVYRELEDYKKAHEYYDIAINKAKKMEFFITLWNNKGYAHHEQGHYSLGIEYFKKAYNSSLKIFDTLQEARALDNMGFTQSKIDDPNALNNLEKALRIRKDIKHIDGIFTSYINLGDYHLNRNNLTKASYYAKTASQVVDSSKSVPQKILLYELKFRLGNFSNYPEYLSIKDSITTFEQKSKNLYATLKYEKEKEVKRAKENELKYEKQKSNTIIAFLITSFIALISLFLYFILKSKHKKEKIQQVYNTETRISKKVHDEVANDIYNAMTKLEGSPNSHEDVIDDLEGIYTRTRDISKENSTIEVNENYQDLLKDLLLSFKNDQVNIIARNISKVNWTNIDDIKKTTLHRVLQELMVNMKKHSQATLVVLSFSQVKNKINITYKDNGIGSEIKKSTGLQNVENRIKSINGTITFESENNKGFKVKITI